MSSSASSNAKLGSDRDFRDFLRNELIRRCKVNPKYSLRAFAKNLGLEPSALSKILNGKRRVSRATFKRLAPKLPLKPSQYDSYLPPQALRRKRSFRDAEQSRVLISNYRDLSDEFFEVISEWYHFAILELSQIKGFQGNSKWIAKALGISLNEAKYAVERLIRLGLLEIKEDGEWRDRLGDGASLYRKNFTSQALRNHQKKILALAIQAIDEVPIEKRDQSSMTMAIRSDLLPEAKDRIKKFRRELCEFLKDDQPNRDQVYHLSVSLYPVTRSLGG